jgi:hypothetical protein
MHEAVPVVWYSNFWWQFEVSSDLSCAQENSKIQRKMTMIRTHSQADSFFFFLMRCENAKTRKMQYNAKMRMRCENAKKFASHCFFLFKNPKKSSIDRSFAFAFASHYQPCNPGLPRERRWIVLSCNAVIAGNLKLLFLSLPLPRSLCTLLRERERERERERAREREQERESEREREREIKCSLVPFDRHT